MPLHKADMAQHVKHDKALNTKDFPPLFAQQPASGTAPANKPPRPDAVSTQQTSIAPQKPSAWKQQK